MIEIKRVENPQSALAQLLDYVNQIRMEFGTNRIKGILTCLKVDARLETAVEEINSRVKEEIVSLMEYSIGVRMVV